MALEASDAGHCVVLHYYNETNDKGNWLIFIKSLTSKVTASPLSIALRNKSHKTQI